MVKILGDGRDFATVKALLACKNAQDVRSSVVGAVCLAEELGWVLGTEFATTSLRQRDANILPTD